MRLRRSAVIAVAVATLVVSPAAAQQDLRSPDARDAASGRWTAPQDGLPAYPTPSDVPSGGQDLRSPDTRDAAAGRDTSDAPQVTVVRLPQPAAARTGGIDWDDVVMSAAVALLLVGLSTAAILHRRRPHAAVSA